MDPITLRLELDRIIISKDTGDSIIINNKESVTRLSEYLQSLCVDVPYSFDIPTASTIGMLAESSVIQPRVLNHSVSPIEDYDEGQRIKLGPLVSKISYPLKDVLQRRVSKRSFHTMSLEDLATVLVRSGRIIEWMEGPDGYQTSHRPVPSAGARHPLELKVITLDVIELEQGLWNFDPVKCELVKAEISIEKLTTTVSILKEVGHIESGPAAIILLVAHFARTLSRYPNGASLVWRDVGVLASILHLCATDIGLASCIVGASQVLDYDESEMVSDVCAVVVGNDASK